MKLGRYLKGAWETDTNTVSMLHGGSDTRGAHYLLTGAAPHQHLECSPEMTYLWISQEKPEIRFVHVKSLNFKMLAIDKWFLNYAGQAASLKHGSGPQPVWNL